jgi:hypothetical protein
VLSVNSLDILTLSETWLDSTILKLWDTSTRIFVRKTR